MQKFTKFLSLFPFKETQQDFISHPLKDDFELWYKHHDYLFCYNMIINGYPAPESQTSKIIEKLKDTIKLKKDYILEINEKIGFIPDDLKITFLSNWSSVSIKSIKTPGSEEFYAKLNTATKIDPQIFLDYFINQSDFYTKNIIKSLSYDSYKYKNIGKKRILRVKDGAEIQTNNLSNLIYNFNAFFIQNISEFNLSDSLKYKTSLESILEQFEKKYIKDLKINKSLKTDSDKLGIQEIFSILDNRSELHRVIHTHFSEHKEHTLSKIKSLNIENNVQEKIIALNNDKSVKNLPQEIQKIIQDINLTYFKLNSNEHIDQFKKQELYKIYNEKIPNIVVKYLNIDPEYRETLVNIEGKKPIQLLKESLTEIQNIFNSQILDLNEEKVKELSVENRLIKSLKV